MTDGAGRRRRGSQGNFSPLAALWILVAGAVVARAEEPSPPAGASEAVASFDRAAVPSAGEQRTRLTIPSFGRYSIAVSSASGSSLQVVDRMAGAGEVAGAAGERDGRLDLFLDRGELRVVTRGAKLATGEAKLSVRRFAERAGAPAERLVDGKLLSTELADLEERGWWIELPKRRRVTLEAAGRNLADLRLWQHGNWLVDATPETSEIAPIAGRPLTLCRLSADLAPGLYRLVAYGGAERPWSGGGQERPLFLRAGLMRDAQALRELRTLSPFGFDRVLVSGAVDFFRLELAERPDETGVTLAVSEFDAERPFEESGATANIDAESVVPVAELEPGAIEGDRVVSVSATPGTPYVLQHFPTAVERSITRGGQYWVSTVAAGTAGDAIDGTAILVELGDGEKRAPRVVAADVPAIGPASGWSGRFQLEALTTLQFEVKVAGEYEVRAAASPRGSAGGDAGASTAVWQVRVEPFFVTPPPGYAPPAWRSAPASWALDPGYYLLEIVPVEAGIAEVALAAKGGSLSANPPRGAAAQLGVLALPAKREHRLFTNDRPEMRTGIVVRELPLDLIAALPLGLGPGEEVEVPFRTPAAGRLRARAEDGGSLEIAIDGGAWSAAADPVVTAGEHRARLRSTSETPVAVSLGIELAERSAESPLPAIAPEALAASPVFPGLAAGTPRPADVGRGEAITYAVAASEPALYRVETTGLLATEAALRTRTQPRLVNAAENGVGRNAELAAYLREGDYQLTVRPRGASAGHLGVALEKAPLDEAGELRVESSADGESGSSRPARARLAPGRALAYGVKIAEAGPHLVSARGLARDFRFRLEDAEGWPAGAPIAEGEARFELAPGDYRLILLPQPVEARAVVAIARLPESAEPGTERAPAKEVRTLALGEAVEAVWHEPATDRRREDRFRFRLPATTVVAVVLTPEMEGELVRLAGPADNAQSESPLRLEPRRPFHRELARGEYELRLRAARRDEGRPYIVRVVPDDWVDGVRRAISPPGDLFLAVGEEAIVELASFGGRDLRARLFDLAGVELAAADDRPGDWNFLLTRRLSPGRYRLRVEAAPGRRDGELERSELGMRVLAERALPARTVSAGGDGGAFTVELESEVVVLPLTLAAGAEIVAVGSLADESVGIEIEELQGESWCVVASGSGRQAQVVLPLPRDLQAVRLRLSSLDRRAVSARVTLFAGPIGHRSEAELARGFDLARLPGVEPPIAAALVDLEAPGCFRRLEEGALLQALAPGSPFLAAAPVLAAVGLSIPLARPLGDGVSPRVVARRGRVGEGEPLALSLPSAAPVVCDVADGGAAIVEVVASSGEPVVAFVAEEGALSGSTALAGGGGSRALAAAVAGRGRTVELWNATPGAVEARLDGWLAREARAEAPGAGSGSSVALTWPLAPGTVLPLALPSGVKGLSLGVARGGVALVARGPIAEAVVWAGDDAKQERLVTAADRLWLFGPRESRSSGEAPSQTPEGLISVAIEPAAAMAPATLDGGRFERRFLHAGDLRLELPPRLPSATAGATLEADRILVDGASEIVLLGADGSLARGGELAWPASGGSLRLAHGPGLVTVVSRAATPATAATGEAQEIAPPAVVALSGAAQQFLISSPQRALLALRSASPLAVALFSDGDEAPRAEATFASAARFDAIVPAGSARLALRGVAGEALAGSALLTSSPLSPLAEGLGAERLLTAGESVAFAFRVARRAPIGVGVRSDRAGVAATLFDGAGRELDRGVVIWRELPPGEYALVVAAPDDAPPARFRPALVGTMPPGDGPPRAEIERFLALAAGEVAEHRGTVGSEDPRRALPGLDPAGDGGGAEEEDAEESYDEPDESDGGEE